MTVQVVVDGVTKVFNRRVIFDNISATVEPGQTLLVTGKNGSGKSTFLKIIAGVLSPTSGQVRITPQEGRGVSVFDLIGFVSPYLNLYDEFTARENLLFALSVRPTPVSSAGIDAILDRVGLSRFKETPARFYSSGMKQRLKYAFALVHRPPLLMLDEPTSNLDDEGKMLVREIMEEQRSHGSLIVATNEHGEITRVDTSVRLGTDG